jgi:hypothetical protein
MVATQSLVVAALNQANEVVRDDKGSQKHLSFRKLRRNQLIHYSGCGVECASCDLGFLDVAAGVIHRTCR